MSSDRACRRFWIAYWSTAWLSAALLILLVPLVNMNGDEIHEWLTILLPALRTAFWVNVFWIFACAPFELLLWIIIPDIFRRMPLGPAHLWLATLGRLVCGWIVGGALMSL